MGQKGERDVLPIGTQVARRTTDGEGVEPFRSPLHRLAPVVLAALGIFGALLTIFAGLVALNHTVLPFKGWPLDGERLGTATQVLPRAPVETGRLRTAPGGALAAALRSSAPLAHVAAVPALTVAPSVAVRVRQPHRVSHRPEAKAAPAPAPAVTLPLPAPAPVAATPVPVAVPVAPAPAPTPVVSSPAPVARRPVTASPQPGTVTTSTSASTGHGHGNGAGRAHAPGRLKKAVIAVAPASAAVVAPAPPADPATGPGNGHGHGPPSWAHGHH
jgi:hypothetical protein